MSSTHQMQQIWDGRRAFQSGNLQGAHQTAVRILREHPRNIDALELKALAELGSGNDQAAEQTLRAAIAASSGERWPYAGLAELLMRHGRLPEAEAVCRTALAADPHNADPHEKLAALRDAQGKPFEAVEHLQKAVAIEGRHPELLTRLGYALLRIGRLGEAREALESAIAADPNAFEPVVRLSELEEREGNFDAAMKQLDKAASMPHPPGANLDVQRSILLARMGKHDQALALLEARSDLAGAELLQRGHLRERAGRYADAWRDWTKGKEKLAQLRNRSYPREAVADLAERLASFFAAPSAAQLRRAERREGIPQPIFIVGFPRSGTTLTERILASHSGVEAGGELQFGVNLHELAVELAGGRSSFPAGLVRAPSDWATRLRDRYLEGAERAGLWRNGAPYFTDKMPTNDFRVPLLRLAFPHSPVILVRRHPLDVLTSVMGHEMSHGANCTYRLDDAARHLALTDELIEKYRAAGFGPTYDLRYESLVANQAEETQRLTAAVGLEMEPAQLSFHERGDIPATPSYVQVSQPLNDRAIEKWRNFARELQPIVPIVAGAMKRGGYTA